jgi:hypothetical protein
MRDYRRTLHVVGWDDARDAEDYHPFRLGSLDVGTYLRMATMLRLKVIDIWTTGEEPPAGAPDLF